MMYRMDEEGLNPPGRRVVAPGPEAAWQPDERAGPAVPRSVSDAPIHDPKMAKLLAEAPTQPTDSTLTPGETVAEPVAETELIDDPLGATLPPPVAGDETLPVNPESQGTHPPAIIQGGPITTGDRFRPIRPHARGGIGLVWVARDCELQRDVALKVIQPKYAERDDQRTRFVLEAEITGKLEHPGIVPVYSLGRDADGRPYYAMRFIRGESLSAAIKRFHENRRKEAEAGGKHALTSWGIEFRQLLGSFLDVCDTIDYAHSQGVLHRDLKPANIMIGRYGETLVVDWGLAKVIGKADQSAVQADVELEPGSEPGASGASGETQQGVAIGTPAYMSPEQAKGAIDELGTASDVYSLGATLYELLTGQLAFPGDNVKETLAKVRKGDFPPPRAVCHSLPAPLDAICCKAMALAPQDRFASVRDLARDIEHWLADEPVTAYAERPFEQMARWFRQHRTWTYAAVATLIGIALVSIIAAVVIEGSRQREADARREAEVNFRMAQDAVDDYLTNVSENTLLKEQESADNRNLRRDLLQNAAQYYQHFVNQRSNDPRLRQELANAYFRLGEITHEIASPHVALDWLGGAQNIWERLAALQPKDDDIQGHLAVCYLTIGKVQEKVGNLQAAIKSFSQAQAILRTLSPRHPAAYQARLAECHSRIGAILAQLESTQQAENALEKARSILEQLIDRSPDEVGYKRSLAEVINNVGFVHYKKQEFPAAIKAYEEVERICQSLLEAIKTSRKPVWLLDRLAKTDYNMATIYLEEHQAENARRWFQQSLDYRLELAETHASVTEYQENLGASYREIGSRLRAANQEHQALDYFHKSLDIFHRLVRSHEDEARYHSQLGLTWDAVGCIRDDARQNLQAIQPFSQAIHEQEKAAQLSKDVDQYKEYLCFHLENLGEQYMDLGQPNDGIPSYVQALGERSDLYNAHPNNREYAYNYADALQKLGNIQRHAGNSAQASELFAKAAEVLDRIIALAADDARSAGLLASVLTNQALALADLQQAKSALPLLERAIKILQPLVAPNTADPVDRERLSEALWQSAGIQRALKEPAAAADLEDQRKLLWGAQPAQDLAALALKELTRAAIIGYGKTTGSPQATAVRDRDLDLAAADLRLAVAKGFTNIEFFKAHPDFGVLLAHHGVKAILEPLESVRGSREPDAKNLKAR
jgi:serine/threonine protein kinase/tetratricopeptide (TPR) repeat protein